ncbi:hypothetical protein [Xanthomonas phage X1]|nr:hypothetical protein [Xanthomonas phage X1]
MSTLPDQCDPCPVIEPFVPVAKLPDVLCPCPEEVEKPSILPTITTQEVITYCLKDALYAMATQLYCDLNNGPKGCR